jgi:thioredoxin reductase (NADPH)
MGFRRYILKLILGTCVNVGCIPKKLFHHISQMGENRNDMNEAGWNVDKNIEHKWEVAS